MKPRVPKPVWVLSYLISPALPFVCLRVERAISTLQCVLGIIAVLVAQIGLVSVLGYTNGEKLQPFIVILLGGLLFLIVLWQYLAGHKAGLWSADAERQWRIAGRFFGVLLALGLFGAIAAFHMGRITDGPSEERDKVPGLSAPAKIR